MLKHLRTLIQVSPTKTIKTAELENSLRLKFPSTYRELGYLGFASAIEELCLEQMIAPVLASRKNGRNPALYNSYRRVEDKLDPTILDELLTFHPELSLDYYYTRPASFNSDLPYLSALNSFLFSPESSTLTSPCSLNERSFQIFRDEKYLASAAGKALLHHVGLSLEKLACYQTHEPFFFAQYLLPGDNFANLLIVENKDTFFSLKKSFTEQHRTISGIPFNFLIYGEGRKIVTSFAFYREVQGLRDLTATEAVGKQACQGNGITAYYFGDLDPEGIDIFGQLRENFPEVAIQPFTYLYQELLRLYPDRPKARDKNQKLKPERLQQFLSYFPPAGAAEIKALLNANLYLPQEGLNYACFAREVK